MEYKGFISYAHKDNEGVKYADMFIQAFKDEAINHNIDVWHDKDILVGDEWYKSIDEAINSCDFAIFLISKFFIQSEFIKEEEFDKLKNLYNKAKNIKLFPILLGKVNFNNIKMQTDWKNLLEHQIKLFNGESFINECTTKEDGKTIFDREKEPLLTDLLNEIRKSLESITPKSAIQKNEESNNEVLKEDENDVFFLLDRKLFKEDIKNFLDLEFNQNRFIVKYIEKLDIADDIIEWLLDYSDDINYQRIIFYFNQKSPDSLLINFSETIEEFRDDYDDEAFENFYKTFRVSKILNLNSKNTTKLISDREKESIKNIDLDELKEIFRDDLLQINRPLLVIINIDSFHNFKLIKPLFNSRNKNIKFIFLTNDYQIYQKNQHGFEQYSLKDVLIDELKEYLNKETNINEAQKENIIRQVKEINVEKVAHNEIKKIMIKLLNIETYSQIKAKK